MPVLEDWPTHGSLVSLTLAPAGGSALATATAFSTDPSLLADSRRTDADAGSDGGDAATANAVYVGLARVCVPRDVRDRVKNDVVLSMALREVTETLHVVVDGEDRHAALSYTCELYTTAWDLACVLGREHVTINIVAAATAPCAWDDFFELPDLGAVFGEYYNASSQTKWLSRRDLLPVAYRSPAAELFPYQLPGEKYFGEADALSTKSEVVIVNGTFDHLHNGHKLLLTCALSLGPKRLVVGVTASLDILRGKPFPHLIEPLETRKRKLAEFVASINASVKLDIVDAHDPWGPAATWNESFFAVVLSTADVPTVAEIKSSRNSGDYVLPLVRMVRRTDRSTLSSRRIRAHLAARQLKEQ